MLFPTLLKVLANLNTMYTNFTRYYAHLLPVVFVTQPGFSLRKFHFTLVLAILLIRLRSMHAPADKNTASPFLEKERSIQAILHSTKHVRGHL